MIVIVFGLPGSGKTFLAARLAQQLNGVHISSDVVRKKTSQQSDYSQKGKEEVYDKMLKEISEGTSGNNIFIVDGTFYKEKIRKKFERANEKIYFIEVKADEKVIKKRVEQKRNFSDADFEVYLKLKNEFEPLKEKHLVLYSDQMNIEEMLHKAAEYINER